VCRAGASASTVIVHVIDVEVVDSLQQARHRPVGACCECGIGRDVDKVVSDDIQCSILADTTHRNDRGTSSTARIMSPKSTSSCVAHCVGVIDV
jgi:hypothetical protein